MSWLDGIGEIDGWCHRCGAELVGYDGSRRFSPEGDFCERCQERADVRAQIEADKRLSREAYEASQGKP